MLAWPVVVSSSVVEGPPGQQLPRAGIVEGLQLCHLCLCEGPWHDSFSSGL